MLTHLQSHFPKVARERVVRVVCEIFFRCLSLLAAHAPHPCRFPMFWDIHPATEAFNWIALVWLLISKLGIPTRLQCAHLTMLTKLPENLQATRDNSEYVLEGVFSNLALELRKERADLTMLKKAPGSMSSTCSNDLENPLVGQEKVKRKSISIIQTIRKHFNSWW